MAANEYAPSVQTHSQTVGGTAEVMLAANPQRTSLWIQPQTEDVTINFGATAGVQATGTLRFDANPANAETIAINGVTLNFLTVVVDPATDIAIGASATATRDATIAFLNSSANASLSIATYSETIVSSDPAILITHDAGGVDGNAYTLADSSAAAVLRGAATLAGGLDTGNGFNLTAGDNRWLNAGEYASFREDVYIVSATAAAKTAYLEGIMGA